MTATCTLLTPSYSNLALEGRKHTIAYRREQEIKRAGSSDHFQSKEPTLRFIDLNDTSKVNSL